MNQAETVAIAKKTRAMQFGGAQPPSTNPHDAIIPWMPWSRKPLSKGAGKPGGKGRTARGRTGRSKKRS